jgi:hypothetical protein
MLGRSKFALRQGFAAQNACDAAPAAAASRRHLSCSPIPSKNPSVFNGLRRWTLGFLALFLERKYLENSTLIQLASQIQFWEAVFFRKTSDRISAFRWSADSTFWKIPRQKKLTS